MDILYIITARGGSKGVPKKNIREINGMPLIGFKIRAVQRCKCPDTLIISTDDEEIAETARKYGCEVPFMRPEELASDEASSVDVILHAMKFMENAKKRVWDYVCLLEPSSPFMTYEDLDHAYDLLEKHRPDTLLGMKEVDVNTCFIHGLDSTGGLSLFYDTIKNLKSIRRQDQKPQYTMNGCMYYARWDYFMENHSFHSRNSLPYIMREAYSVEIDSEMNYAYAKFLAEEGYVDMKYWK